MHHSGEYGGCTGSDTFFLSMKYFKLDKIISFYDLRKQCALNLVSTIFKNKTRSLISKIQEPTIELISSCTCVLLRVCVLCVDIQDIVTKPALNWTLAQNVIFYLKTVDELSCWTPVTFSHLITSWISNSLVGTYYLDWNPHLIDSCLIWRIM